MTPLDTIRIRHLRRTTAFERVYVPAMYAAINAQVRMFVKTMKERGISAATSANYPADRITKVIKSIYERIGMFYARVTTREIRASIETKAYIAGRPGLEINIPGNIASAMSHGDEIEVKAGFGINEEMNERILEALTRSIFADVANISETTKKDLLRIINEGVEKGWSVDKIAYEIEHSGFPLRRARLIVRTELAKAMNAGQQAAKEESDWETNDIWISAHDKRTRHSHIQIDGARIREGEKFPVRKRKGGFDMMTGPGDPEASAENVCNCRCTKVTRAARDQNGRLIRKRKIFVALPGEMRRPVAITI